MYLFPILSTAIIIIAIIFVRIQGLTATLVATAAAFIINIFFVQFQQINKEESKLARFESLIKTLNAINSDSANQELDEVLVDVFKESLKEAVKS